MPLNFFKNCWKTNYYQFYLSNFWKISHKLLKPSQFLKKYKEIWNGPFCRNISGSFHFIMLQHIVRVVILNLWSRNCLRYLQIILIIVEGFGLGINERYWSLLPILRIQWSCSFFLFLARYCFWTNLVKKIKIVILSWNLVPAIMLIIFWDFLMVVDETWKTFSTNFWPQRKYRETNYQVRKILVLFRKLVALTLH